MFGYVSLAKLLGPVELWLKSQTFRHKKLIWIQMNGAGIFLKSDPKVSSTSGIEMSYSWNEAHSLANSGEKIGRWLREWLVLETTY